MSNQKPTILWTAQTRNRKTGNVPTAWVGESREESKKSCEGCPLLASKTCYSQNGVVAMGHNSLIKARNARLEAAKEAKRKLQDKYTLEHALNNRAFRAKAVRLSAIGDAARCDQEVIAAAEKKVRSLGLGWLSYTHFHDEIEDKYKYLYTASSGKGENLDDDIASARALLSKGWKRVTAVVPWNAFEMKIPKGSAICPAMRAHAKGARVSCNECRLCDPAAKGPEVILFPRHSSKDKKPLNAAAKAGKAWAINLLKKL